MQNIPSKQPLLRACRYDTRSWRNPLHFFLVRAQNANGLTGKHAAGSSEVDSISQCSLPTGGTSTVAGTYLHEMPPDRRDCRQRRGSRPDRGRACLRPAIVDGFALPPNEKTGATIWQMPKDPSALDLDFSTTGLRGFPCFAANGAVERGAVDCRQTIFRCGQLFSPANSPRHDQAENPAAESSMVFHIAQRRRMVQIPSSIFPEALHHRNMADAGRVFQRRVERRRSGETAPSHQQS
jgi:hypothetical protein